MDSELDEDMKESFYFSHDYNSRADAKIKRLLAKHGMQGFGVFWAIVEDLYNNDNNLILDLESISYDLRVEESLIKSVIENFDLFTLNDGILRSESIQKRLDKRNEKSIKASESAKLRWDKSERNANALQTDSEGNAIKESKGKDNKGNKIINIPFEQFYNAYGKKVDRDKAELKWNKLTDEERCLAMEDTPKYIRSLNDRQFQKNPATYLHNKSWKDERLELSNHNPTIKTKIHV